MVARGQREVTESFKRCNSWVWVLNSCIFSFKTCSKKEASCRVRNEAEGCMLPSKFWLTSRALSRAAWLQPNLIMESVTFAVSWFFFSFFRFSGSGSLVKNLGLPLGNVVIHIRVPRPAERLCRAAAKGSCGRAVKPDEQRNFVVCVCVCACSSVSASLVCSPELPLV